MSKRHKQTPRRPVARAVAPPALAESPTAWAALGQQVDVRELLTGAFIVSLLLIGSTALPGLFAEASSLLLAQLMFEFPMALLAVCAGQAVRHDSQPMRAACVITGLLGVALAGSVYALQFDAPWAILSGFWMLAARVAPARGIDWFSVQHCRAIEVTAGAAWVCLIGALLLLSLGNAMLPAEQAGQPLPALVYALAWGAYYLGVALLLPRLRRHHALPKRQR